MLETPLSHIPMMLSEKAKGKQKAADPPTGVASTSNIATSPKDIRSFIVRFTEDAPDLELAVNEQDTIRDVKRYVRSIGLGISLSLISQGPKIRDQRPEFKDRRLRLMCDLATTRVVT